MDITEKITQLPDKCGVYVMRSAQGEVLYIGKANSIRSRVRNHFSKTSPLKSAVFTEKVDDLEYILCDTPEQALLIEAALIKEKKPKYNVALRDDKTYPYVGITQEEYPRMYVVRPQKKNKLVLLGPFTNVTLLHSVLKLIRKVFPYRSCRTMPKKPCLYYHLGLCLAPCCRTVSVSEYEEIIDSVTKILSGCKRELLVKLKARMENSVAGMRFEEAARIRDTLAAVEKLYSGKDSRNGLLMLKEMLNLKVVPAHIDAIDISNISGAVATGSVVVFKNGLPDKSNYRRYKIKTIDAIDDYGMVKEVVLRRYRRLRDEQASLPDLIVIDGGQGHVNAAVGVLTRLGLDVPLIGIAKKKEEIWLVRHRRPLSISRDNPGLFLIQRIRDEAHRFARKYHLWRRDKKMFSKKKLSGKSLKKSKSKDD
ncbi:MAG: GIY-YIG nuclease family protein [Candidatus Omnitrophica bacterium]|nr:GIY-YIG nuclease family protein [Candidatus Omnitrophota bacterium]